MHADVTRPAGFAPDVPYATVVIELAEGVRMVSQVRGLAPEQLHVGLPVEMIFDDVTPEVTLPKFRPLSQSIGA